MIMERVDFTDSRFELCKAFITASNRGKGQNIRIMVTESNVKKFLNNKTTAKIPEETNRYRYVSLYGSYIEKAVKTVESSVKQFNTCYGWGYGDWIGANRKKEILEFEEKLTKIKDFYDVLDDIGLDTQSFTYIDKIEINKENKLKMIINKNGIKNFPDLEKLIKFFNLLGYDEYRNAWLNESLAIFEDIDIEKVKENKIIWEFL